MNFPKKRNFLKTSFLICIGVLITIVIVISLTGFRKGESPKNIVANINGIKCESMEGAKLHYHAHISIINNGVPVNIPS